MTDNTKTRTMNHLFPRSTTSKEKYLRLLGVANPLDTVGILINADPDSMASALALKRLFWRKVKKTEIYHINSIQRADNLAFINHLKIELQHIKHLKRKKITKWAIVDSQPHHHDRFRHHRFDIIIDHHPVGDTAQLQGPKSL
jgi:nanoRNase/pAp phosphatase (c-di-AMP/oligoRNAs hydrolase)